MAIAIALPGFNSLGRSVTPSFLLIDHFLYRFSTSAKTEENLSIRSLNPSAKCTIEFRSFKLFVRWFQMPLEGKRFVKTLATFEIINATYSLFSKYL